MFRLLLEVVLYSFIDSKSNWISGLSWVLSYAICVVWKILISKNISIMSCALNESMIRIGGACKKEFNDKEMLKLYVKKLPEAFCLISSYILLPAFILH